MSVSSIHNPPAGWQPCSPELLMSGVSCADARRWSAEPVGQHWHPPVGAARLIAFQVGDNDVVAAYTPEGAIAVFAEQSGVPSSDFTVDEVEAVSDERLDSRQAFNQDDGKLEELTESLREEVSRLTQPTYLYGWE